MDVTLKRQTARRSKAEGSTPAELDCARLLVQLEESYYVNLNFNKPSYPESVGVVAAEMGTYLYDSLGFKTTVKITVTDPRPGKQASVDFWVQKWNATDSDSE